MPYNRQEFEKWLLAQPQHFRRKYLLKSRYRRLLFRYQPATESRRNHLHDLLVRSRLWMSSPTSFNDPFDGAVAFRTTVGASRIRGELLDIGKKRGIPYKKRQRFVADVMGRGNFDEFALEKYQLTRTSIGVHCFAQHPKNLVMWGHYADSHRGVCLGFDIARGFPLTAEFFPVDYTDEYPVLDWVQERGAAFLKAVLRKSRDWEYEKEWRFVRMGAANSYISFDPAILRILVLGSRAAEAEATLIRELLAERATLRLPPVRVMRAVQEPLRYSLKVSTE